MNLFKNLKMKFAVVADYWIWILVILLLSSGCSTWNWHHPKHYEWEAEEHIDGGWDRGIYHYYVIDTNADEPDAYFETRDKALTYKSKFSKHHDYVIVKIDEKYNVYNMAKPISLTP